MMVIYLLDFLSLFALLICRYVSIPAGWPLDLWSLRYFEEPLSDASASHPKLFFNGYNKDVLALFFIQPNWLLVWEINNQELILVLLNTGTHSDLFGKKYKKG